MFLKYRNMLEIVLFVRKGVRNTEIRRKFFNLSENVSETPKFVQNELSLNDFYLAFNCVQYETSFNHLQKFHSIVFTFSNEFRKSFCSNTCLGLLQIKRIILIPERLFVLF
jgi:hypothetical protein